MMESSSAESLFVPTFIARQPIFDLKQNIWGFELLYRHSNDATAAVFSDEESATLAVAACATCQRMHYTRDSKLMINFSQKSIVEKVPQALAPEESVIEIHEALPTLPGYVECLQQLKHEGYHIALDGYEARPGCEDLFKIADILKIDMVGKSITDVSRLLDKARGNDHLLIAKRIEEHEQFLAAKNLDFTLFQGFFFLKPEVVEGRQLTANQASRLQLFAIMEAEEPDFDKLTDTIQADVAISYSLLSYLNSPSIGLREKIKSIKQAILLLGWRQIKNWLRVVILRDMSPSEKTSELPYASVQRGKFFQLASSKHNITVPSPDSLFLLGLFSLLEPMLSMPMAEIVSNLPLEEDFKAALCGTSNQYTPWLQLAKAFETADWDTVDTLNTELGLESMSVAQAYYESISWSSVFFEKASGM